MKQFSIAIAVLTIACSNPEPVWPHALDTAVECVARNPAVLQAAEDALTGVFDPSEQLERLALETSSEAVVCAVKQLVDGWATARTSEFDRAYAKGVLFLEKTDVRFR